MPIQKVQWIESFTGETGTQLIPTTKEKTLTAKWLWGIAQTLHKPFYLKHLPIGVGA